MAADTKPGQTFPRLGVGPAFDPRADLDRPPRVLVVDDDRQYRELAAEPFRKRGDKVRVVSNGVEALAAALKERPDVILSDVQMPRMDGWQFLRLIRARPALQTVPVIFLTLLDGDRDRMLGYQLGVDAYIAKPYAPDELLIRVHQAVRRARSFEASASARPTLRGDLANVAVSSVLAWLDVERKTGVLVIVGSSVARILLREGRILRVELEGHIGGSKNAIKSVLEWRTGEFEFNAEPVECPDEVQCSTPALLIEHARITDEANK